MEELKRMADDVEYRERLFREFELSCGKEYHDIDKKHFFLK